MKKYVLIMLFALLLMVSKASASTGVNVVVVGMINHGMMQPTVNAIKNVTSQYPGVNVTWFDLESAEGQAYAQKHGLTAHLNILINGRYKYDVNGSTVTFQWFEGQEWTKADLDTVISGLLTDNSGVASSGQTDSKGVNVTIIFGAVFAVIAVSALFMIKKFRK